MEISFKVLKTSRNTLLKILENTSLEHLNTIPEGFSNNIIWNIGHIVVVQQMLVYKLSGLPMMVSDEMVERYKKGTRPEASVSAEEVAQIKDLLFPTIEQTERDYNAGVFKEYQEFTTMTGFHSQSAADAITFNNFHEALHTGIIMQIKKFV
jgi:hypothetical protein